MATGHENALSVPQRMSKLRGLAERVIQDMDYAAALHANLERLGKDASLSTAFDNTPHVKALNVIYRALIEQLLLVLMRIDDGADKLRERNRASLPNLERLLRDEEIQAT